MLEFITILVLAALCSVSGQVKEDPRCVAKNCPLSTTCRIVKDCSLGPGCSLVAQCLENPPRFSHTGVCQVGDPILVQKDGQLQDLTCGTTIPCPGEAYCNTDLMDTYATCCVSDPDPPLKNWTCPPNTYTDDDFCLDTCNNDGDCRGNDKCCTHGCNRECLPRPDPCGTKKCGKGTYCFAERMQQPLNCATSGSCHSIGDCVPCGPVCLMDCPHGNVLDPNGCPICRCKTGPPPPPMGAAGPSVGKSSENAGNRPGVFWPGSRSPWMSTIPPWIWAFLLHSNF